MKKIIVVLLLCISNFFVKALQGLPKNLQQLQSDFVDLRSGVMMHLNMGTFTNKEWAKPGHDPKIFDPKKLDGVKQPI